MWKPIGLLCPICHIQLALDQLNIAFSIGDKHFDVVNLL